MASVRDHGRMSTKGGFLYYEATHSKQMYIAGWSLPNQSTVNGNLLHFIKLFLVKPLVNKRFA